MVCPTEEHGPQRPRRITVLSPGIIPTTDLYFRKNVSRPYGRVVGHVNTLTVLPSEVTLVDKTMIVIVRYAPPRWLRWLNANQARLAGVALFMDDDIPAAAFALELPFLYILKTVWRHTLSRRLLSKVCDEIWVSTPELVRRYAARSPVLIEPEYIPARTPEGGPMVYFYHGSWAHRREIRWLVPVVRQVQASFPDAWFEIMGADRVWRLFRGIPRVRVIHPMPWTDYLSYAGSACYQVGLAPCFDTHFNRARSHSKIFDITRLGAAGIYSNCTAYATKVAHGQTGLLCENITEAWVSAIIRLLADRNERLSIYRNALAWAINAHNGGFADNQAQLQDNGGS